MTFTKTLKICAVVLLTLKSCTTMDHQERNKQLVVDYFNHFNKHNWADMADMYTAHAKFKDPEMGHETVTMSKEEIIAKYVELQGIFTDIKDEVITMYTTENNVIVEFVSTGTAPDNTKFLLPICTIFEFDENGKITKDFTYYDNAQ